MSDLTPIKISELPDGATPLDGTELVPLNQGGTTVKVAVADIAAAPPTSQQLGIYVSQANGDDSNDGLTPTSALATLLKAATFRRANHSLVVHLDSGNHAIADFGQNWENYFVLIGDGAGQPGDTGVTPVASLQVETTVDTGHFQIDPVVADIYRGKTLRWTSGNNTGRRVLIASNLADGTIAMANTMAGAIQVNDSFEIEAPAVVLQPPAEATALVRDCGGAEERVTTGLESKAGACLLVNIRLNTSGPLLLSKSRVYGWGVEIDGAMQLDSSSVRFGTARSSALSTDPEAQFTALLLSLIPDYAPTAVSDWEGWGLTTASGIAGGVALGYLVAPATLLVTGGLTLNGGSVGGIWSQGAAVVTLQAVEEAELKVYEAGIQAGDTSMIQCNGALDDSIATVNAVRTSDSGRVIIATPDMSTVKLGGSAHAIDVQRGGSVSLVDGLPAFSGASGDITVDGVSTVDAAIMLPFNGAAVTGPTNGAVARRVQ